MRHLEWKVTFSCNGELLKQLKNGLFGRPQISICPEYVNLKFISQFKLVYLLKSDHASVQLEHSIYEKYLRLLSNCLMSPFQFEVYLTVYYSYQNL